jgi:hypothetical protein
MGNKKQDQAKSRRGFFSSLMGGKKEKVKMLTPDGQLVEIDKEIFDALSNKQKVGNKEILDWMKNPSTEKK